MTTQIQLPRKLASKLLNLAQRSPTKEICGLISCKTGIPTECYSIENIAEQPQNHFLFEPKQHIAAIKKMRENGEEILAIYHSHPTAPAFPSAIDLELINYKNALYFIISLSIKGVLELRAFHITNQKATEVQITL